MDTGGSKFILIPYKKYEHMKNSSPDVKNEKSLAENIQEINDNKDLSETSKIDQLTELLANHVTKIHKAGEKTENNSKNKSENNSKKDTENIKIANKSAENNSKLVQNNNDSPTSNKTEAEALNDDDIKKVFTNENNTNENELNGKKSQIKVEKKKRILDDDVSDEKVTKKLKKTTPALRIQPKRKKKPIEQIREDWIFHWYVSIL